MSDKVKQRQQNWCFKEVCLFIDLCEEHKIVEKSDGKRFRVAELMLGISTEMEKYGFSRDANSLVTKWKQLKQAYRATVQHNEKSGIDPSKFPYFEQMSKVMGSRSRQVFPEEYGLERDSNNQNVNNLNLTDDGSFDVQVESNANSEASNRLIWEEPSSEINNGARKRKRGSRSYGAALLDFSEDFGNRMAEINKEFIKAQKEMHDETSNNLREKWQRIGKY